MDTVHFLHLLHDEIRLAQGAAKKHIIHFPSDKDYWLFNAQFMRLRPSLLHLSSVKNLRIIRAVSCSLRSDSEVLKCPWIQAVEEDSIIRVHEIDGTMLRSNNQNKSLANTQIIPWGVGHIRAPEAWRKSMGSRVKVGVIDTGIDYHHPDLQRSISRGINLLNRSLPPFDDNGHGTHIAGTIAAASRKNGILGVAPRASIHPVKAFDYSGNAYVSDIIAGIDWCVQNRLDIINMSFGMKTFSKALEYAVLNAYQAGTIIVASSGNDGRKATVDYPARFQQVVSVGAVTRTNKIASFSNRGKRIDIYAPGERIYSAWLHGKYNEMSGTSMATAHVSGVIALMLALKPSLKPQQIKLILKRCSISLGWGKRAGSGAGRINARRAVSALK